jgi:CRISPR/Cas system Type II protein with McrA/HNH and RuvC-like nuclease domain
MRYAIDKKPIMYKPIRPLKEEYITLIRDNDGNVISTNIEYKYYDAPEKEPYNDKGLNSSNISYTILKLLDDVNNKTHGLNKVDYN